MEAGILQLYKLGSQQPGLESLPNLRLTLAGSNAIEAQLATQLCLNLCQLEG